MENNSILVNASNDYEAFRKIAEDKVTEHNEDTEAHPNDFNLKGITIGKDNVIATKKGDLLTLLAGKGINLLSDIKNKIITIVGKSKNAWNPNEEIIAGDIRYTEDGNGPSWAYLLCKTAGTTSSVEPTLEANAIVGQEINDGSVVWTVQNIRPTALDSYPVGSIYMSVNSTSPADLFGGTWEAMPAGRVLLAQGTSEWGVEYQAGSTGGEHEHQLSVGELPAHNHNVTVSTSGDHAHTFTFVKEYDAGGTEPGSASWRSNQGTKTTEQAGTHTHTVTISNTGSNYPHNNLQPYISVYCWHRTAQQPVGELPAHRHIATISTDGEHTHAAGILGPIDGHSGNNYAKYHFDDGKTGSAGSHAHTLRISDTGNSQSHNIMQPYIAVYCWRRSA